jgi:hypothetical protein
VFPFAPFGAEVFRNVPKCAEIRPNALFHTVVSRQKHGAPRGLSRCTGAHFSAPERIYRAHSGAFGVYFDAKKGDYRRQRAHLLDTTPSVFVDIANSNHNQHDYQLHLYFLLHNSLPSSSCVTNQSRKQLPVSSQWDRTLLLHQTRWVVLAVAVRCSVFIPSMILSSKKMCLSCVTSLPGVLKVNWV